jgi:hypothetical protein
MGKFETGYATNFTAAHNAETANILVKPDVYSMKYQAVSDQYTTAANIQSDHGIGSTVETHMMKRDEWGAVLYLSQSAYGKYGNQSYNGADKEVYVNNAYYSTGDIYITGRSNGIYGGGTGSGSTQYGTYEYNNCPASGYTHSECTESTRNANNTKGTGASNTGNIYGVYDMSGGADDDLMSKLYDSNYEGLTGFTALPMLKYINIYSSNSSGAAAPLTGCNNTICYGQAFDELYNSSNYTILWYNDRHYGNADNVEVWGYFGGNATDANNINVGIFTAYLSDEGNASRTSSFRVSIS